MNVSFNKSDSVNAIIKVQIEKADYEGKVEKALKEFKQKANVPGFRKGMVPMGMVKKMYGTSVLVEQINRMVADELFGYIKEHNIDILGEPLPNITEQKEIDFKNDSDFEFCFDLGLAPELNIEPSKKDKIDYYEIEVSESDVDRQIEMYADRFGTYDSVEVIEEDDVVKGSAVELDENGDVKEGGITVDSSMVMPKSFKSKTELKKFIGKKVGAVIKFNPKKACGDNLYELGHILNIDKEEAGKIDSNFNFTVVEVTRHALATLDTELYNKVLGEGVVSTEEEFRAKVKEIMTMQLAPEADYKFWMDAQAYYEGQVKDIVFPDAFLKRFLQEKDEEKTAEAIEEEYPAMMRGMAWHLLKEKFAKKLEVKIEPKELKAHAISIARMQFAQYGMNSLPDDVLDSYADRMLTDEKQSRSLLDKVVEDKLIAAVKEQVTLKTKKISQEEFSKLFA